jgi:hypothetical protein
MAAYIARLTSLSFSREWESCAARPRSVIRDQTA